MAEVLIRDAAEQDSAAIAAVAIATRQHDEWSAANPAYTGHLMQRGRVVVAELGGKVAGFGAVQQLGTGPDAVTILCDLFVDPTAHGKGCGRAMLTSLWAGAQRRMTFSSLHAHAVPLYTSFGLDAWWPLLYLHRQPGQLPLAAGWTVERATADEVAQLELGWTAVDRTADLRAWNARPGGATVIASVRGEAVAAGAVITAGPEHGIQHLALSPASDDTAASAAVLAVLAVLGAPDRDAHEHGAAHVCLPAPHPAVRPLLAAGWRFDEFDLFMATEPGLIDPRRAVPSPGQA
jgi:GNAT superfamily N-acetyltransferase